VSDDLVKENERLKKIIDDATYILLRFGNKGSSSAFRLLKGDYYNTSLEKEISELKD